ncbi:hypothetical protein BDW60DRAFT_187457 [Aspergillus nidulans var. acristatus]
MNQRMSQTAQVRLRAKKNMLAIRRKIDRVCVSLLAGENMKCDSAYPPPSSFPNCSHIHLYCPVQYLDRYLKTNKIDRCIKACIRLSKWQQVIRRSTCCLSERQKLILGQQAPFHYLMTTIKQTRVWWIFLRREDGVCTLGHPVKTSWRNSTGYRSIHFPPYTKK